MARKSSIRAIAVACVLVACGSRTSLDSGSAGAGGGGTGGAAVTGGTAGTLVTGGTGGTGGGVITGGTGGTAGTGGTGGTMTTGGTGGTGGCSPEICDGLDNDCDGVVDNGLPLCPCKVASFGGHIYHFCAFGRSWQQAAALCSQGGAHLASLASAAESNFASKTAASISTTKWWMGMDDIAQEGVWVWIDSSPVTYTNWEAGEPNNAGGNEDCGQLLRFYPALTWNDEPCDEQLFFVCETD